MVDAGFVGRTLDPAPPYRVSAEKIAEFARAVGEDAAVCLDPAAARAAGHPDVVAPPTFTVTFTMPLIEAFLRDPAFGWDYARMVHADQSIVQRIAWAKLFNSERLNTRFAAELVEGYEAFFKVSA